LSRFENIDITDISNAVNTKLYTFETWVYIQSYMTGGFGNYSFEWNRHLKINLGYQKGKYTSTCYPIFERLNSAYENSNNVQINFTADQLPWVYLRCSVDISNKLYFHYNQSLTTTEQVLNTSLTDIPSSGTVSLKFVNNNKNRGIIFLRLLRLFNCYDCNTADIYRLNWITPVTIGDQIQYENLMYHVDEKITGNDTIDRSDVNAETKQKIKYIKTNDGTVTQTPVITQVSNSDFLGYNVVDLSSSKYLPLYTPKSTNNLYPENQYLWSGLIKLNEVQDVKIDQISPSFNGRYTFEFWYMVDDITKLTKGFHIIWRNLASVTIIQDSTNTSFLNMFCWPQDFKLNVETGTDIQSVYGADIFTMLNNNKVLNYEKKVRSSSINNTWTYVRCAVNTGDKVYYSKLEDVTVGTPTEVELKSDVLFSVSGINSKTTTSNDYPFRYYFQNGEKTYIQLAGMSLNTGCTIYVRNIWLFTEYLPIKMDFRHL